MKRFIFLLIFLGLAEISLSLYLTFWREEFWDFVAAKNSAGFLEQLEIFTAVALVICFVNGMSGYMVTRTAILWREQLNAKALLLQNCKLENVSQRIQEDAREYPALVLELSFGLMKSLVYILVFTITFLLSFEWYLLAILLVYAILGTTATRFIAKPLIGLNYQSQRAEATYRSSLEIGNFRSCIMIMLGLAKRQKQLSYLQNFYGQVGVVLPLIIIAPIYFTTNMTVGTLMRFNSTSSTILENLSYGVSSFGVVNRLLSCRRRLKEMGVI